MVSSSIYDRPILTMTVINIIIGVTKNSLLSLSNNYSMLNQIVFYTIIIF